MTGDVTVFVGTVSQMRAFAAMVLSEAKDGSRVPPALMESAAASMLSQIEADLAFHPSTRQALREWNSRSEVDTQTNGA